MDNAKPNSRAGGLALHGGHPLRAGDTTEPENREAMTSPPDSIEGTIILVVRWVKLGVEIRGRGDQMLPGPECQLGVAKDVVM